MTNMMRLHHRLPSSVINTSKLGKGLIDTGTRQLNRSSRHLRSIHNNRWLVVHHLLLFRTSSSSSHIISNSILDTDDYHDNNNHHQLEEEERLQWRRTTDALLSSSRLDGYNDRNHVDTDLQQQQELHVLQLHGDADDDVSKMMELAAAAIRYWTRVRTPEGVQDALLLFRHVILKHLLLHDSSTNADDDGSPTISTAQQQRRRRWCTGHYPRVTHLLNAMLDSWRIATSGATLSASSPLLSASAFLSSLKLSSSRRQDEDNTQTVISASAASNDAVTAISPRQMWCHVVEPWVDNGMIPIDARTCTIILTAAMNSNSSMIDHHDDNCPRKDAPLLGQEMLSFLLQASSSSSPTNTTNKDSTLSPASQQRCGPPDVILWTAVLQAWCKSGRDDHVQGALQVWQDWQELITTSSDHGAPSPTVESFNTLLEILCNGSNNDNNYMDQADELLRIMQVHGYHGVAPDTVSFQLVIFGWANKALSQASSPHSKAAAEQRANVTRDHRPELDESSSSFPLDNADKQSRVVLFHSDREETPQPDPLQRAYRILRDTVELDLCGFQSVRPDATFFAKLLSTAVRLDRITLAEEIHQDLLDLAESEQDDQRRRFAPDDVFTKRSRLLLMTRTGRAEQAQQLLDEMEADAKLIVPVSDDESSSDGFHVERLWPKPSHYRDVLLAWIKNGDPHKAEAILLRLLDLTAAAESPAERHAWVPHARLIEKVLWSWASLRQTDYAGFRAELLLRKLQDFAVVDGGNGHNRGLDIGAGAYQQAMMAWARTKSRESAENAELLMFELLEMEKEMKSCDDGAAESSPNKFHYMALLVAWSKVRGPRGVRALRAWFDNATETLYRNGSGRVDQAMYGAIIQGLMNSGEGELAVKYWESMLHDFENGNSAAKPTISIMNMVLTAWERSSSREASKQVVHFLESMESWSREGICDLHPNRRSLEIAIRAVSKHSRNSNERDIHRLKAQLARLTYGSGSE